VVGYFFRQSESDSVVSTDILFAWIVAAVQILCANIVTVQSRPKSFCP